MTRRQQGSTTSLISPHMSEYSLFERAITDQSYSNQYLIVWLRKWRCFNA